eukprot:RCo052624
MESSMLRLSSPPRWDVRGLEFQKMAEYDARTDRHLAHHSFCFPRAAGVVYAQAQQAQQAQASFLDYVHQRPRTRQKAPDSTSVQGARPSPSSSGSVGGATPVFPSTRGLASASPANIPWLKKSRPELRHLSPRHPLSSRQPPAASLLAVAGAKDVPRPVSSPVFHSPESFSRPEDLGGPSVGRSCCVAAATSQLSSHSHGTFRSRFRGGAGFSAPPCCSSGGSDVTSGGQALELPRCSSRQMARLPSTETMVGKQGSSFSSMTPSHCSTISDAKCTFPQEDGSPFSVTNKSLLSSPSSCAERGDESPIIVDRGRPQSKHCLLRRLPRPFFDRTISTTDSADSPLRKADKPGKRFTGSVRSGKASADVQPSSSEPLSENPSITSDKSRKGRRAGPLNRIQKALEEMPGCASLFPQEVTRTNKSKGSKYRLADRSDAKGMKTSTIRQTLGKSTESIGSKNIISGRPTSSEAASEGPHVHSDAKSPYSGDAPSFGCSSHSFDDDAAEDFSWKADIKPAGEHTHGDEHTPNPGGVSEGPSNSRSDLLMFSLGLDKDSMDASDERLPRESSICREKDCELHTKEKFQDVVFEANTMVSQHSVASHDVPRRKELPENHHCESQELLALEPREERQGIQKPDEDTGYRGHHPQDHAPEERQGHRNDFQEMKLSTQETLDTHSVDVGKDVEHPQGFQQIEHPVRNEERGERDQRDPRRQADAPTAEEHPGNRMTQVQRQGCEEDQGLHDDFQGTELQAQDQRAGEAQEQEELQIPVVDAGEEQEYSQDFEELKLSAQEQKAKEFQDQGGFEAEKSGAGDDQDYSQ